jgi:hypothetical protein
MHGPLFVKTRKVGYPSVQKNSGIFEQVNDRFAQFVMDCLLMPTKETGSDKSGTNSLL